MKFLTTIFSVIFFTVISSAQITKPEVTEVWEPVPRVVTPGEGNQPPSDAFVLFDGSSASAWTHLDGSPVKWTVKDGIMTIKPGTGNIKTKQIFGDCQLHIEWQAPDQPQGDGQDHGNSGVFLQQKYEVQVLDSYQSETYVNGQAASIYKQYIPLVNAMNPPDKWNVYDIIFKAPVFNADGIKVSPGYLSVLHNGVLVQNHVMIKGTTEYIGAPQNPAHGEASLELQDHGNMVKYRNIWIRKL